jgi:hypothetical protein
LLSLILIGNTNKVTLYIKKKIEKLASKPIAIDARVIIEIIIRGLSSLRNLLYIRTPFLYSIILLFIVYHKSKNKEIKKNIKEKE